MIKSFYMPKVKGFEISYYLSSNADMRPPKIFPSHSHDVMEFYFHISGNTSFVVEKELYPLKSGDCIISRPHELHNCVHNSTSEHKHACIWINSPNGFGISNFLSNNYDGKNLLSPLEEDKKKIIELLYELDESEDDFNRLAIILNILKILRVCACAENEQLRLPETLKTILDDINENFKDIQDVEDLLTKYFISKSTMSRMFKKYLNTTPKTYLETKKLTYARILLKNGESVCDACFLAGFTDYSNFIRLFRKRFNITPGKYKTKDVTLF